MIKVGITGHRPPRVFFNHPKNVGYSDKAKALLERFAVEILDRLFSEQQIKIISGGALGWDTATVSAAQNFGHPFDLRLPHPFQGDKWNDADKEYYETLIRNAEDVTYASREYSFQSYLIRDRMIVNECEVLVALFDGTPTGGTVHTVKYAKEIGREIKNVWNDWVEFYTARGSAL